MTPKERSDARMGYYLEVYGPAAEALLRRGNIWWRQVDAALLIQRYIIIREPEPRSFCASDVKHFTRRLFQAFAANGQVTKVKQVWIFNHKPNGEKVDLEYLKQELQHHTRRL